MIPTKPTTDRIYGVDYIGLEGGFYVAEYIVIYSVYSHLRVCKRHKGASCFAVIYTLRRGSFMTSRIQKNCRIWLDLDGEFGRCPRQLVDELELGESRISGRSDL
jgi:hypothetical protein